MNIITESILVESKTARDHQIAKIQEKRATEILNKIKSLYFGLWKKEGISTTEKIAEFFEVEAATIRKILNRHQEELRSDGVKTLKGKDLKDVRDILSLTSRQSSITIWTPRSALRLGMLLRDSTVAIAVRTSLLNAVEKVIPAVAKQQTEIVSLPSAREQLETIKLGIDLFSELGGCDKRTEILLKDRIRNILLENQLQPSLTEGNLSKPMRLEYPVSDRAIALGYRPNNSQLQQIGKCASRLYQEKYDSKPPQREQFVGGTTRMVNVYGESDLELLDEAIFSVMDKAKIIAIN